MLMYSQNGYTANQAGQMATYTVPGAPVKITLRQGDVSVVLLYVAEMFHKTVQALRQKDCGGYNPRLVRGSATVISNHASGSAEDADWNSHPRGRRGTFTSSQVTAIRKILAYCEGAVRWGGDYKTAIVDEMHFEIVGSPSAVARVADKIRVWRAGTNVAAVATKAAAAVKAPAWPAGTPPFQASAAPKYSVTVLIWQTRVKLLGEKITCDGRYGPGSAATCRLIQHTKGLVVDGQLGPKTFTASW